MIAGDNAYPPFEFVDSDGSYRGYNVDVMKALSEELGIPFRLVPMAWAEAIEALRTGEVDAIQGIANTQERLEKYDFAFTEPYLRLPQTIFVDRERMDVHAVNDLRGRRVAVQTGGLAHDLLADHPEIELVFFENQKLAMEALASGEVAAHVGNRYTGLYNLQREDVAQIKLVGDVIDTPYSMAVLKGDTALLACLDGGIEALTSRGSLDRAERIWFGQAVRLPPWVTWWLAGLTGALTLILVVSLILRQQVRARTRDLEAATIRLEQELAERGRAEGRVSRLLDQQIAANQLALSVGEATDLESVYRIAYDHVRGLMDTAAFIVSFYDRTERQFRAGYVATQGVVRDVSDYPPVSLEPPGQGTQSEVVHTGESVYLPNLMEALARVPSRHTIQGNGTVVEGPPPTDADEISRSSLLVPMKIQGETIGVMQVQSYRFDAYTPDDIELLSAMANVVAVAIQDVRLLSETNRRAERLAVVNRVARAVGATLRLDELLETVYREVAPSFAADAFLIALYEAETDELDYRIQMGEAVRLPPERHPLGEGLISHVVSEARPLLVRDFDQELGALPSPQMWGTMKAPGSWLGVPMRIGEEVTGVICVQAYRSHAYGDEEQELLSTIADQVAVAVHNARLFEAVQRELKERQRLQEQLSQAQTLEAIGRLAGGVAHDFNNLLTVINGFSRFAHDALDAQDPIRGDIGEVINAGERAAALTRQLLAFSRRQVMEVRVLNLNQIIREMRKMLGRLLRENITLEMALADDLGNVEADPGQIERVIVNLAVNASDAMPEGGTLTFRTANVTLGEAYASDQLGPAPGAYAMLVMSDNGVGMTEEIREHIFEPFFTTKEKGKGTGLGLAMVYGIVRQSKGHIECESQPGRGSTFRVYLPRVDQPVRGLLEERGMEGLPGGRETVLLVEDQEGVRHMVATTLERLGYTLLEAKDGQEALAICQGHDGAIDLLLTDVIMPKMNGPYLAERAKELRPTMVVIYMSGYTDGIIDPSAILAGGAAFIRKPFSPASLALKVRQALD